MDKVVRFELNSCQMAGTADTPRVIGCPVTWTLTQVTYHGQTYLFGSKREADSSHLAMVPDGVLSERRSGLPALWPWGLWV